MQPGVGSAFRSAGLKCCPKALSALYTVIPSNDHKVFKTRSDSLQKSQKLYTLPATQVIDVEFCRRSLSLSQVPSPRQASCEFRAIRNDVHDGNTRLAFIPIQLGSGRNINSRNTFVTSDLSPCPRRESNPDLRFRKPSFYPLNYKDS
jgi:hypothetical protein